MWPRATQTTDHARQLRQAVDRACRGRELGRCSRDHLSRSHERRSDDRSFFALLPGESKILSTLCVSNLSLLLQRYATMQHSTHMVGAIAARSPIVWFRYPPKEKRPPIRWAFVRHDGVRIRGRS